MTKSYTIRRYTGADIEEIIACAKDMQNLERKGVAGHFKGIAFSDQKVYKLLSTNEKNAHFFTNLVIDDDDKIIGILSAMICEYYFSDERLAQDLFLYFDEKSTNISALKDLIKSYVSWARYHKVREAQLKTSSGDRLDKFAVLMKRTGFSQFEAGFSKEF